MSSESATTLLARYNRRANESLATILKTLAAPILHERVMWYGTLLGTLNHVVLADTVWLRRVWPEGRAPSDLLGIEFTSVDELVFPELAQWARHRAALDDVIVDLCEGLSAESLDERIHYETSRGETFAQPRWQLLLHMFNHETHHRGQIAQVLDAAGVENDISNIVWYLREGL